jgi:hypothetical protein
MTRGKKPEAVIDEAKSFAERMGYRRIDNPHPDLGFDFEIFKAHPPARESPADAVPDQSRIVLQRSFPGRDFAISTGFRSRHLSCGSSGSAPATNGPGAGPLTTISRLPKLSGGSRTITRIPMPGETTLSDGVTPRTG